MRVFFFLLSLFIPKLKVKCVCCISSAFSHSVCVVSVFFFFSLFVVLFFCYWIVPWIPSWTEHFPICPKNSMRFLPKEHINCVYLLIWIWDGKKLRRKKTKRIFRTFPHRDGCNASYTTFIQASPSIKNN